jgi:hypothetical protein
MQPHFIHTFLIKVRASASGNRAMIKPPIY